MIIYIKEHPSGAGKWIYKGYESAWRHLGFEVRLYSDLLGIEDKGCSVMAIDHDIKSERHLEVLKRAKHTYLYVQPNSFPHPWGKHPNFVSQVPFSLLTQINETQNIYKWSFAETAKSEFYSDWDQVEYLPLAFDSINYKELNSEDYAFDVCYIGGWADNGFNEKRKIILDYLSVFKQTNLRCGFAINRGVSHEQENIMLSTSKVAINIHDAYQHALGLDTNERTFKSLGLCGILVSDNVECLKGLFPNVPLATNPKEMLKITKEICEQPNSLLLEAKAKNRENILSKHTYIERVETMLSLNNEP